MENTQKLTTIEQLNLKKALPYINQIWCPFHKDQLIQSVCIDNNCNEKILCYLCEIYSTNHSVIPLSQFYNSLTLYQNMEIYQQDQFREEIQKAVEGKNLEKKLVYFQKAAQITREEFQNQHVDSIEKMMNGFIEDLNQMVSRAKQNIINMYQKMTQDIFSEQSLQEKEFKDKACRLVMKQLQSDDHLQANQTIRKMHQGVFELAYAKQKVLEVFSKISNKIEHFVATTEKLVNSEIHDFEQVFKTIERKDTLSKSKLFRRVAMKATSSNNNSQQQVHTDRSGDIKTIDIINKFTDQPQERQMSRSNYYFRKVQTTSNPFKTLSNSQTKNIRTPQKEFQITNNYFLSSKLMNSQSQKQILSPNSQNFKEDNLISKTEIQNIKIKPDELIFEEKCQNLIQDVILLDPDTFIMATINGQISVYQNKKKMQNNQKFEKIWSMLAHDVMGLIRQCIDNYTIFFSVGSSKELQIQVKIWHQQHDLSLSSILELQEMHTKPIRFIEIFKETVSRVDQKNYFLIYIITSGDDGQIKTWEFNNDSGTPMNTQLQKISSIEISPKNMKNMKYDKEFKCIYMNGVRQIQRINITNENQVVFERSANLDIPENDKITGFQKIKNGIMKSTEVIISTQMGMMFSYSGDLKTIKHKIDFLKVQFNIKTRQSYVFKSSSFSQIINIFHFDGKKILIHLNNKEKYQLVLYDPVTEKILNQRDYHDPEINRILKFDEGCLITIEKKQFLRLWKEIIIKQPQQQNQY